MDEILKAYSQPKIFDDALVALEVLQFGFSPTYWITRDTLKSKEAIERYRNIMHEFFGRQFTEEMLIGQAFGL